MEQRYGTDPSRRYGTGVWNGGMERVWSRSLFRTSYFDLHPYIYIYWLVVYLPLWKMMEWVTVGFFHDIPNVPNRRPGHWFMASSMSLTTSGIRMTTSWSHAASPRATFNAAISISSYCVKTAAICLDGEPENVPKTAEKWQVHGIYREFFRGLMMKFAL